MRPATPIPATIAATIAVILAAFLLAGCRAPDPELPDEPPKPQAGTALPAPAGNVSRPPRSPRPVDRTPTTPDLPPLGTDNPVWQEAAGRGIEFRALGQEPGWYVEVGEGNSSKLYAVLDYGERTLDIANAEALPGGTGYRGADTDGTEVVLRIEDRPCQDGMSGHRFPATVQLTVGGETYNGCGARL